MLQHESVHEVAVVGVPDEEYGEEIVAVLAFKEGKQTSEKNLTDFCAEQLSSYKLPRKFKFLD